MVKIGLKLLSANTATSNSLRAVFGVMVMPELSRSLIEPVFKLKVAVRVMPSMVSDFMFVMGVSPFLKSRCSTAYSFFICTFPVALLFKIFTFSMVPQL